MSKRSTFLCPSCCLAVLWVFLSGCGPPPALIESNSPAQVFSYIGAPPVTDARARFREIFSALLEERHEALGLEMTSDDYLWRLSDEPRGEQKRQPLPRHDAGLSILIVSGAFSDCAGNFGAPYRESSERLREMGYHIATVDVSGLSSSDWNAAIIADAVAELQTEPSRPVVLLGYSKGTTDILHFLAEYPSLALRVTAVVSIAGAVIGSPLVDRFYRAEYGRRLAGFSPGACNPSDGGLFDSLGRANQFRWLAAHPLPRHVRYFSLATFAGHDNVQLLMQPTYKLLGKIDPRNDGQLLAREQVVPGSALLGYVNADHWTIAVPVEEWLSLRAPDVKHRHRKLRDLLFETIVLFVVETLKTPVE